DGTPIFDKPTREVIQELWMRWRLAQAAKIIGRADDSATEQMMPNTIHNDTRGQRVVRARQIVRKLQPRIGGFEVWLGVDRFEKVSRHDSGGLLVTAANEQRLIPIFGFDHAGGADRRGQFHFYFAPAF